MIKIHIHNKDITYLMFISLIHFIFRTTKIHHLIQTSDFTYALCIQNINTTFKVYMTTCGQNHLDM